MKIELQMVGKTSFGYLSEGMALYEKRLRRYVDFKVRVIPDVKNAKSLPEAQIKEKEGEVILSKLEKSDFLILLDDKGMAFSSPGFSQYLEQKLLPNGRRLIFLVGGAYGFSPEVYARADAQISLSPMTFSHQMVRLFFLEQLYRAFTIIKGEPYHHE